MKTVAGDAPVPQIRLHITPVHLVIALVSVEQEGVRPSRHLQKMAEDAEIAHRGYQAGQAVRGGRDHTVHNVHVAVLKLYVRRDDAGHAVEADYRTVTEVTEADHQMMPVQSALSHAPLVQIHLAERRVPAVVHHSAAHHGVHHRPGKRVHVIAATAVEGVQIEAHGIVRGDERRVVAAGAQKGGHRRGGGGGVGGAVHQTGEKGQAAVGTDILGDVLVAEHIEMLLIHLVRTGKQKKSGNIKNAKKPHLTIHSSHKTNVLLIVIRCKCKPNISQKQENKPFFLKEAVRSPCRPLPPPDKQVFQLCGFALPTPRFTPRKSPVLPS